MKEFAEEQFMRFTTKAKEVDMTIKFHCHTKNTYIYEDGVRGVAFGGNYVQVLLKQSLAFGGNSIPDVCF